MSLRVNVGIQTIVYIFKACCSIEIMVSRYNLLIYNFIIIRGFYVELREKCLLYFFGFKAIDKNWV